MINLTAMIKMFTQPLPSSSARERCEGAALEASNDAIATGSTGHELDHATGEITGSLIV